MAEYISSAKYEACTESVRFKSSPGHKNIKENLPCGRFSVFVNHSDVSPAGETARWGREHFANKELAPHLLRTRAVVFLCPMTCDQIYMPRVGKLLCPRERIWKALRYFQGIPVLKKSQKYTEYVMLKFPVDPAGDMTFLLDY